MATDMTAEQIVKAKYPDAWRSVTDVAVRIFAKRSSLWGDAIGIALVEEYGQRATQAAWADAAKRIKDSSEMSETTIPEERRASNGRN